MHRQECFCWFMFETFLEGKKTGIWVGGNKNLKYISLRKNKKSKRRTVLPLWNAVSWRVTRACFVFLTFSGVGGCGSGMGDLGSGLGDDLSNANDCTIRVCTTVVQLDIHFGDTGNTEIPPSPRGFWDLKRKPYCLLGKHSYLKHNPC
jgi:hypothetical protein